MNVYNYCFYPFMCQNTNIPSTINIEHHCFRPFKDVCLHDVNYHLYAFKDVCLHAVNYHFYAFKDVCLHAVNYHFYAFKDVWLHAVPKGLLQWSREMQRIPGQRVPLCVSQLAFLPSLHFLSYKSYLCSLLFDLFQLIVVKEFFKFLSFFHIDFLQFFSKYFCEL